jgi:hypothetical protein
MWRSAPFRGTLFLVAGGYLVLTYLFGANRKMVLTPDGITVDSRTRLASPKHQVFAWTDVTATQYSIKRNAQNLLYGLACFEIYAGIERFSPTA